jgi:ubiquinone/menaquinone biosynthesis C-methylase UbiE
LTARGEQNIIKYSSKQLVDFYKKNRIVFEDLYPSEKNCLDRLNLEPDSKILDIGCAIGSLGWILRKKFGIQNYIGIDVNKQCVDFGNHKIQEELNKNLILSNELYCCDVEEFRKVHTNNQMFDYIFSFSGLDWNTNCRNQLAAAYQMLNPGGRIVITFRCHPNFGLTDIKKSFQLLKFNNLSLDTEFEKAPYNFMSCLELMTVLDTLNPSKVYANGYWNKVGNNVNTVVESLVFVCAVITKRSSTRMLEHKKITLEIDVPREIKYIFAKSNRYLMA